MRSLICRLTLAVTVLIVAAAAGCTTGIATTPDSSGSGSPHEVQPPGSTGARPQIPASQAPNPGNANGNKDHGPQTKAAAPGIAVSPESVQLPCPGADCAQPVTIRSTGSAALIIYDMSIHNDSSKVVEGYHAILPRQCVDITLQPGGSCTFYVSWFVGNNQSDIYTAQLLIFDNLPDQPTYVSLTRQPTGPIVGS